MSGRIVDLGDLPADEILAAMRVRVYMRAERISEDALTSWGIALGDGSPNIARAELERRRRLET